MLNRRQFIQATASVATVATLTRLAPAAGALTSRPFGFSLYGLKSLPLLEAIDEVARIGYRQVELSLMPGFPAEPAKLSADARRAVRERIRMRRLELSSLLVNITLTGDEKAQAAHRDIIARAGELAHDLAYGPPPIVETILGGKPDEWEKSKSQFAARLRAWVEVAGAADVTLCIKAHADQAVNTPERLLWLHREINHPRLALVYDYSHFQFEKLELEETLRALLPFTRFIHVKDVALGETKPRYLLVGEGAIDYVKYFRLLDAMHYEGPVIVEVSSQIFNRPGYDGVRTAEKCHAFLANALHAAR